MKVYFHFTFCLFSFFSIKKVIGQNEIQKIYKHNNFELIGSRDNRTSILSKYIFFYNQIIHANDEQEAINDEDFRYIFKDDSFIPIDFPFSPNVKVQGENDEQFGDKVKYNRYFAELVINIRSKSISQCEVIEDSIYYGVKETTNDNDWFIWIKKIFIYKEGNVEKKIAAICKLTISKPVTSGYSYKITNIDLEPFPKDEDHDFIADKFDACVNNLSNSNPIYISIGGCEAKDLERVPSSRFAVSLSGGLMSTLNNEFTEKDIMGTNAFIKPAYFNKLGYILDLNGIYTINSLIGIRFGCLYARNSLDNKALGDVINTFLADNGANAKIRFNSTTRKIYIPYLDLRIGNFKKISSITSLEGIFGMAFPTTSSKNITYQITTAFGGNTPDGITTEYSAFFQSSPFPVYGVRLNYEFSLMKDNLFKFFVNANYLTGNYDFKNQEINAPSGNKIIFKGSTLQLWGVSVGLHYNLVIPKKWKEKDKLNAAQSIPKT